MDVDKNAVRRNTNQSVATPLQQLLSREVTRKEFMALAATGLAAVAGFDRLIGLLTHGAKRSASSTQGFGSGPYGGTNRVTARSSSGPGTRRIA
jgi:hypothetical protein